MLSLDERFEWDVGRGFHDTSDSIGQIKKSISNKLVLLHMNHSCSKAGATSPSPLEVGARHLLLNGLI